MQQVLWARRTPSGHWVRLRQGRRGCRPSPQAALCSEPAAIVSGGGAGGAGVRAAVIPGMRRVVEVAAAHQGPAAGVEAAPITVSEIVSEWLFSGHEVVTVRMGGARAHALAEVRRGLH